MKISKLILMVEDNPDHELLTLRALLKSEIEYRVVIAKDGQEALDYLFGTGEFAGRDTSEQPDVVLLDLNLPKINGLEVLKQIRNDSRTRFIPVTILSTSTEESDIRNSYELYANSYVQKPVRFEEFNELVQELGNYWLTVNTAPTQPG